MISYSGRSDSIRIEYINALNCVLDANTDRGLDDYKASIVRTGYSFN